MTASFFLLIPSKFKVVFKNLKYRNLHCPCKVKYHLIYTEALNKMIILNYPDFI